MSVSHDASQVPRAGNVYHQVNVGDSGFAFLGNAIFNSKSLLAAQKEAREEQLKEGKEEERRKCHQALKTSNYEREKDINPERAPQTCLWVLDHGLFKSWRSNPNHNLLWISADPGCGKSVLSKYLADLWARDMTALCVCYYFFKDNSEQSSLSKALCAVLHQLFHQQPHLITDDVLRLWNSVGQNISNETTRLWHILRNLGEDDACWPIVCVLDALDECEDNDRRILIKFLCDFHVESSAAQRSIASRNGKLKFLVTSRPYDNVRRWFDQTVIAFPQIRLRGEDKSEELTSEINRVVVVLIRDLAIEFGLSAARCRDLITTLVDMKHRTYLWLHLAIEDLRNSFCNSLDPEYEKIVPVPASVEDAYERILSRVDSRQQSMIRTIFKIIIGARRPLTVEEMAVALAVKRMIDSDSHMPFRVNVQQVEKQICHWCALFVFIDDSRVHFIHQTAKEFLVDAVANSRATTSQWRGSFSEHDCEAEMTHLTIEYLSLRRFRYDGSVPSDPIAGKLVAASDVVSETSTFHAYSAQHWPSYAECNHVILDEALLDKAISLCSVERKDVLESWFVEYFWKLTPWHEDQSEMLGRPVICVATETYDGSLCEDRHFQYDHLVATFINNLQVLQAQSRRRNLDLDAELECGCTPLLVAVACGHHAIVRWLLSRRVKVNVRSHERTPLLIAVRQNDYSTVQALIQDGADVDCADANGDSALMRAITQRLPKIAELLLSKGARAEKQVTKDNKDILNIAANIGWLAITEKLIMNGVDVNMAKDHGETALRAAIVGDNANIVSLLLRHGADGHARLNTSGGRTPLIVAAAVNAASCATVLLEWGADTRTKDLYNSNALEVAFDHDSSDTVAVLLRYGASVDRGDLKLRYQNLSSYASQLDEDAFHDYVCSQVDDSDMSDTSEDVDENDPNKTHP